MQCDRAVGSNTYVAQTHQCPIPHFDDLLAAISHEIRTPLTAVLGFCDLMVRETFGPIGDPRYAAYVRHIAEGGTALLKSAEDTLALSALIAGSERADHRAAFDLEQMVRAISSSLAPLAAARAIVVIESVPSGLMAVADRTTYRQAVTNLVLEAIDRTADGGHVEIAATLDAATIKLSITAGGMTAQPVSGAIPRRDTLALRIARALIDRDGSDIFISVAADGSWRAEVQLVHAAQSDLFNSHG